MSLEELRQKLRRAGVAGAGGAGFPSYAKLSDKADTIILNCAECEPLLRLHRQVLAEYAFEILTALSVVAKATGAKTVIIALKKNYKDAINSVKAVLDKFNNFKISYLPEVYPAGDEVITIYETTGRVVPPGEIPLSVGVTVFNVETALNIYNAVFENTPVTHKYVSVAGAVENPITVKAPLGMTFSKLIELAGGATCENYELISGGPMMGTPASPADTVTKTTNAVLVFPEGHKVVENKKIKTSIGLKRAMAACCQCRACTVTCSRNLLGHPIEPHLFMRSASSGDTKMLEPFLNTMYCSGCGICEMYSCPQDLSPRTLITEYKNGLKASGVKIEEKPVFESVDEYRKMKLVPMARLVARLGLRKYDREAPLDKRELKPDVLRITMSQSVGAPSRPIVESGEKISKGDIIAMSPVEALGLPIHSPVDGTIKDANEHFILINCD